MNNPKFIELIGDYCNDSLDPKDRETFERKIRSEPNLASFLRSYEMTTTLCSEILKRGIPDGAQDRLNTYLKSHIAKLKTKEL